jgi:hypothetical protein
MKFYAFNKTHTYSYQFLILSDPLNSADLPNVSLETPALDNRLRGGGKVVSLTRRLPFNPRKIAGTNLC